MATERDLGSELKQRMEQMNWSATRTAAEMDVSEATVSRLLSGVRRIGPKSYKGLVRIGIKRAHEFLG